MKGYVRAQTVVFGNFKNYIVDSKNIIDLMNELKNFDVIPNVIDEVQLEIKDNNPIQRIVKRIQLNSNSHKLRITILDNSIEIQAIPQIEFDLQNSSINIENFVNDSKEIFSLLLKNIGKMGNRISLVTTYLNENEPNNKYTKYVKPIKFFETKDVFEWNVKNVVRESWINNVGKEEKLNVIYNICKTTGMVTSNLPKC